MKTPEQIFEEWVNDEISFEADLFGLKFTRANFEEFCKMFHDGRRTGDPTFPMIDRIHKTRDEARKALRSCGWPNAKIDAWLLTFLSAQNMAKYSSTDEVASALRIKAVEVRTDMGWSATPYEIP